MFHEIATNRAKKKNIHNLYINKKISGGDANIRTTELKGLFDNSVFDHEIQNTFGNENTQKKNGLDQSLNFEGGSDGSSDFGSSQGNNNLRETANFRNLSIYQAMKIDYFSQKYKSPELRLKQE